MYCKNCGQHLPGAPRMCPNCGQDQGALLSGEVPGVPAPPPRESTVFTGMKLGFGACCLLPVALVMLVIVINVVLSVVLAGGSKLMGGP